MSPIPREVRPLYPVQVYGVAITHTGDSVRITSVCDNRYYQNEGKRQSDPQDISALQASLLLYDKRNFKSLIG